MPSDVWKHKTCHGNGDYNRDKQTCFGRDSPLLINVMITVNEVQVPPSQSLSWVGVEVLLWTAHHTSYSVSWLYWSFLNYPNKLVHCIPMCHFCACYIDSVISFFLHVIFSIVVAQGLDNLPSQPSILHFLCKGISALKKNTWGWFFLSKPREPTYYMEIYVTYLLWKIYQDYLLHGFLWLISASMAAYLCLVVYICIYWIYCNKSQTFIA